jgi:hypothetical protein
VGGLAVFAAKIPKHSTRPFLAHVKMPSDVLAWGFVGWR